ncbi:PAS domain-containing protein [Acidicapsa ligni]|uniref:PAS domain-containing protein n=1 Tax=Acidicapsa ligni TaxID=542300 RepID=UPI0021E08518|nr:PAS domain-containing protein [Acidicapsa ligni]
MNLQSVIDQVPAFVWYAGPDGSIEFLNRRGLTYTGFTLEQIRGWSWRESNILHPDDMESLYRAWSAIVACGKEGEIQARMRRFDGEYRWFLFRVAPLQDEMGTLIGWLGVDIEIDERQHAQDQLRRSELYLAEAQRLSQTGSFGWNVSTNELYFSEESFRVLGWDRATKPTLDLVLERAHPEDVVFVRETLEQASRSGRDFDFEHRLLMPDGSVKHVRAAGYGMKDETGNLEFAGAVMDITSAKQTEEKLQQFSGGLLRLLNTVPALLHTALPNGDLDFFNQPFLQYVGVPTGRIEGWGWTTVIHPEDVAGIVATWHASIASGEPFEYAARLRRADGEYRWMVHRKVALRDEWDKIIKWYGSSYDIEDMKRAEGILRESEAVLRQIVDSIPGLVTHSPDGETEFHNQHLLDFFGKTLEQMRDWSPNLHPDDRARVVNSWLHALATEEPFEFEYRAIGADGRCRWQHSIGQPVRGQDGRIVRWINLHSDIDKRKQAEEKLKLSEGFLAEAQRLSHSGSWSWNMNTDDSFWSQEMFRILGYDPATTNPSLDHFLERVHPEDRTMVERMVKQETSGSGGDVSSDYRIVLPDGTTKHLHAIAHPVTNESGEVVQVVGTSRDVTEQVQARRDLEKAFAEIKVLKDQLYRENLALRDEIDRVSMFEEIVGTSPALQAVLSRVIKVAPTDSTVLITGETGTGKELIARAIHRRSHRSSHAFVSVNCAVIPRDLIASELFGHEKGAFTGATQRRLGRFELAGGGTIFLDEVGELPVETQIALLRVLQEHEFERVGGTLSIKTDVRVITATNRDLPAAIAAGTFRSDLFYRLNVFPVEVPPLRDRTEDIPMLVEYFIDRFARKAGKSIREINKKSLDLLVSYAWPGNIRELQNIIERSVIVCETETFSVDESWISRQPQVDVRKSSLDLSEKLAAQEKEMIEAALRESEGRVFGPVGAAAKLGMPRSTLESKIRSLKINKNRFKK